MNGCYINCDGTIIEVSSQTQNVLIEGEIIHLTENVCGEIYLRETYTFWKSKIDLLKIISQ